MTGKVMIVGASGVVGNAALEAFLEQGWQAVAVSRRKPEIDSKRAFDHLSVDLRDAQACRDAFGGLSDITHVVYAAVFEKPGLISGWSEDDQMQTNLQMLTNLMEPLASASTGLRHVSLLQGTKAYGIHLHPMPIPARESNPRDDHPNFYWLQEDYLRDKASAGGFAYTILRPQLIVGAPYGAVMNLIPVIGAYAAICAEEGLPFGFPGGPSYVWEAVDARLLANVFVWATDNEQAAGQHFNVTNGDVFEWRNLWPAIADTMGLRAADDRPCSMAQFLPEKAALWDRIVEKHGLRKVGMPELLGESHHYADFCFAYGAEGPPPPAFVSAIKLRQAGFTEVCDTQESFRHWLQHFIDRKILPRA